MLALFSGSARSYRHSSEVSIYCVEPHRYGPITNHSPPKLLLSLETDYYSFSFYCYLLFLFIDFLSVQSGEFEICEVGMNTVFKYFDVLVW